MLQEVLSKMPQVFEGNILLRGEDYFIHGHVLNVRFSEGLLRGRVKGSSNRLYDVHMDLKKWPALATQCSCTSRFNCKHAVACLFAIRAEQLARPSSQNENFDKKLDNWLKNLRAEEAQKLKNIQIKESAHQLIYWLELEEGFRESRINIKLALAKRLKKGGLGKPSLLYSLSPGNRACFTEDDNDIVGQLLFRNENPKHYEYYAIRDSVLLKKILATGRAFFVGDDFLKKPLQLGEPLVALCRWEMASDGSQNLRLLHDNKALYPIFLECCWYQEGGVLGEIETPYSINQLKQFLDAPAVPLEQAALVAQKMAKNCPEFPSPQVFLQEEVKKITPTPILIFDWIKSQNSGDEDLFVVKVEFDYEGIIVGEENNADTLISHNDNALLLYPRDRIFEEAKKEELEELLPLESDLDEGVLISKNFNKNANFLHRDVVPKLQASGWRVIFAHAVYQEVLSADEVEWYSDLEESGTDFFSYQLGILIEGKPVSIVPLVVNLIRHYGQEIDELEDEQCVDLPLEDGRRLKLEIKRIKPLIRLLLQFGLRSADLEQTLKMNKYQLLLMQEAERALAATKARWQGAELIRMQLKKLSNHTSLPAVSLPQNFQATLRDYQQEGLNWLQFLRQSHFNGILADDMGLGKTVQTLAHLLYEKEHTQSKKASLIVAPTSLVENWQAEAARFAPSLRVLVYHGSERHLDEFDDYDLIVSTYGLIQRDKERFLTYSFYYLILDEAQFIKNARTKTTQIIQQLQAEYRLCLTGTPLENHLGELWSLFHFLLPGLLGDAKQFKTWFRNPIEKHGDGARREILVNRVKPFILRRTKNQVVKELPPKTEMTRRVEIVGAQRDLYEAIRMSMEKKVRDAIVKQGLGKSHIILLDALLKLRQICCDPRLLSLSEAQIAHGSSAKLEMLMELLDSLVDEGRRILIFSQFTSMLKLIEEALQQRAYSYLKLTGQTKNRQALVNEFQEGNTPVFLISLKAGGTGLNLTKADTVIHYDPWWNPAVEEQATDRSYRIGQENPVFVYKLITQGTVEEAILEMQDRKRQLVGGILAADSSQSVQLSEADLQKFFAPLD